MRYLIVSDIHANLAALEAVLADVGSFDAVWCLGDLVGYGPDPNECIARIQGLGATTVVGNHDCAALGQLSLDQFNQDARVANAWTREKLTADARAYLETLPRRVEKGDCTLVHGSPREPTWEYILDVERASANFEHFDTRICLVGHTHVPGAFIQEEDNDRYGIIVSPYPGNMPLDEPNSRLIINPGSVGQPRDGDPRASYAILDTASNTWQQRRIAYPIEETQDRMRAYDLSYRLIKRLEVGR
ncbi:MAG: metallophosphoesterase family protein [Anaerolineae bacterium]